MPYRYRDDIATADAAFEAWGDTEEEMIIAAADASGFVLGDVSLSPYVAEGLKVLNPLTMARLLMRQETLTTTLSDNEEKAAQ